MTLYSTTVLLPVTAHGITQQSHSMDERKGAKEIVKVRFLKLRSIGDFPFLSRILLMC